MRARLRRLSKNATGVLARFLLDRFHLIEDGIYVVIRFRPETETKAIPGSSPRSAGLGPAGSIADTRCCQPTRV
jgi:hypothetical protein